MSISVEVDSNDFIEKIKTIIEEKEGVPRNLQILIFAAKQLDGNRTLSYYNIKKDSTLHLTLRLLGGAKEETFIQENLGLDSSSELKRHQTSDVSSPNKKIKIHHSEPFNVDLHVLSKDSPFSTTLNDCNSIADSSTSTNKVIELSKKNYEILKANEHGPEKWRACLKVLMAKNIDGSKKYNSIEWLDVNVGMFKITDRRQFCLDYKTETNRNINSKDIKSIARQDSVECLTKTNHEKELIFKFSKWDELVKGGRLKVSNQYQIFYNTDKSNDKSNETNLTIDKKPYLEKAESISFQLVSWLEKCNSDNKLLNFKNFIEIFESKMNQRVDFDGSCSSTCNKNTNCSSERGTCICRILNVECSNNCSCRSKCTNNRPKLISTTKDDCNKSYDTCAFNCPPFSTRKGSHYVQTHLPALKYICLQCDGYVKTSYDLTKSAEHMKRDHPLIEYLKISENYTEFIPSMDRKNYEQWYIKETVFATHQFSSLKYPISEELYKWASNKLTKEDYQRAKQAAQVFNKTDNIPNRGPSIKNSFIYFDVTIDQIEDNKITRETFLKLINKIGQTIDGVSRKQAYHITSGKSKLIKAVKDGSQLDVIYCEHITTQNFNVLNLKGSKTGAHHWHIDPSIINFRDQNFFAIYLFDQLYNQFINDPEVFDQSGKKRDLVQIDNPDNLIIYEETTNNCED